MNARPDPNFFLTPYFHDPIFSLFQYNAMPNYYDPNVNPDRELWLLLDEQDRISQAENYHKKRGIRLPNITVHATFHAIVENQIAEGEESVIRAMDRLRKQGLNRHDSIHAIAWVWSQHLFEQMKTDEPDTKDTVNARYVAAVERLNADDWRSQETE